MHVTTDTTGSQTFSAAIREASWDQHRRAESSPVLAALVDGRLERDRYAALLAQYRAVYAVLEEAAAVMHDDPVAGPFVHDELTRVPALDADIAVLLSGGRADDVACSDATQAYCDQLRSVCFDWPGGFVAHHYVRYLGDLSGGQFIAKVVERVYDVDGDRGARFYRFDRVDDLTRFKDEYRGRLDTTPWTPEERSRIIDEILRAYELNIALHDSMT